MAAIVRSTRGASLATRGIPTGTTFRHPSRISGAAVLAGDNGSLDGNGLWQLCNATAATAPGRYWGTVLIDTPAGESCSPHYGVTMFYADGTLTPGNPVFLSAAVPGGLDTVAQTGSASPCGVAIDASHITFVMPRYVN